MPDLPPITHEAPPVPFKLDMDACREAFLDPTTPATVLHVIVLAEFGFTAIYGDDENHGMDPIELWEAIKSEFKVDIDEACENRLNAMMLGVSSDAFYNDPRAFGAIVRGLLWGDVSDCITEQFTDLTATEISIAEWELHNARGDDMEFAPDVLQLIIAETQHEADDVEDTTGETLEDWRRHVDTWLTKIGLPEEIIRELK